LLKNTERKIMCVLDKRVLKHISKNAIFWPMKQHKESQQTRKNIRMLSWN
jgi:hypothetical protein